VPLQDKGDYTAKYAAKTNGSLVTITDKGVVSATGKGTGEVRITVTLSKKGAKDVVLEFKVFIRRNAVSVRLSGKSEERIRTFLTVGEKLKLEVEKSYDYSYTKGHFGVDNYRGVVTDTVKIVSLTPDVAEVSGFTLTAKKAGIAQFEIYTYQYGNSSLVTAESVKYVVEIEEKGTLSVPGLANTQKGVSNWASVSPVQQFSYKDEGFAFAYISDDKLNIVTPNKTLSIATEYPRLGDVVSDDDGNFYVVWGKEGVKNTDQTVFISKYSSEGTPVKTTGFIGESVMGQDGNTKFPFNAGNCVSTIANGYLMVNYARGMYNGHQSNNVVGVRLSDMSPVTWNSAWDIPYTSHSFNQDIIWSKLANDFLYADHGDAYGRGFIVTLNRSEQNLFHFYLPANANYNMYLVNKTWAQLGGIAETSKGVVLVGASARSIGEAAMTEEKQDLFIQIFDPTLLAYDVSPSMFIGGANRSGAMSFDINDNNNGPLTPVTDYGVRWLTNYNDRDVITPQVVEADDKIVILWATNADTFYMVLSASGDVMTPATSLNGQPINSYEKPIYYNGIVYWASVTNGMLKIRSVNIANPSQNTPSPTSAPVSSSSRPALTIRPNSSSDSYETVTFDDKNFESAVRKQLGKTSGNITRGDVAGVTNLNLSNLDIKSLAGIEYFTALKQLYCYDNQLITLDVSKNTALTTLYCYNNQLISLDVSKNTALTTLYCSNNQLIALDVSKNTALTGLSCHSNQLKSLDLSKNTALTYFAGNKSVVISGLDSSKTDVTLY